MVIKEKTCKHCNNIFISKYGWTRYCSVKCRDTAGNTRRYKDGRKHEILGKFNLTIDDYNKMLKEQNSVCAICNNKETAISNKKNKIKDLAVDHCHETRKIRGLLCSRCNQGLGLFKHNTQYLLSAAEYTKRKLNGK